MSSSPQHPAPAPMDISGTVAEDLALYREKFRRRLPQSLDELHGPTQGVVELPLRTLVGRTVRVVWEGAFPLETTSTEIGDTVRVTYEKETANLRIVGDSFDTSGSELDIHADMANFASAEPTTCPPSRTTFTKPQVNPSPWSPDTFHVVHTRKQVGGHPAA